MAATNIDYFGLNSLNHLWSKIKEQDSSLWAKVETELGTIDTQIQNLDASVSNHESRISSIEGQLPTMNDKITDLQNHDTSIDASISSLESRVDNVEGQLPTMNDKITALQDHDTSIDASIASLESRMDTAEGDINGIITDITDLQNHDTSIDASIASIESRIAGLATALTYKGTKDTYEQLPDGTTETRKVGDVWNVIAAHDLFPAGTNYAWNGSDWDALGGSIDTSAWLTNDNMIEITNDSIDEICV